METKHEYVTLDNLGKGAAAEMFSAELERVIANITDPNTKAGTTRKISLTLKVKPNKERSLCACEIACVANLAPAMPFETQMFVGMEGKKARATEFNPSQGELFEQPAGEKPAGVTDIATARK